MHKSHLMSHLRITLPITLEHSEIPVDLKVVSMRDFLNDPDSAEYRSVPRQGKEKYGPFDPWELREEFFICPVDYWRGFVEMAGSLGTFRISKKDFAEWQALLREAILLSPRDWARLLSRFDSQKVRLLSKPLPIQFLWDGNVPEARIVISGTLPLIIATIQIDVLRGAQFRTCARTDCVNPPFKLETRHKIYCSPECAHLVAVRNSRARIAKDKDRARQAHKGAKTRD